MHRFFIPRDCFRGNEIFLKDQSFHHVCKVCRFQKGKKFILISKNIPPMTVELTKIFKDSALAKVIKKSPLIKRKKPYIHLALSCPRFMVVENLLRKCVELDVAEFHPFVSDFSFIRKVSSISKKRIERWEAIVQNSMAQSLNPNDLKLCPPSNLKTLLEKQGQNSKLMTLFFYEGLGSQNMRKIFDSCRWQSLDQIWIFIGSEGGFSHEEVSLFKSRGISPLTLGHRILKVETACLTILGILKYKLGHI